jgi:L-fucose mutarotase
MFYTRKDKTMLKGIPKIVSPELLKVLCEMGHGDEIVIADGNFPCESMGKNAIVVRADGNNVPEILDAVLALIPLDQYYATPVALMEVVKGDTVPTPVIWNEYDKILKNRTPENCEIEYMERFAFYERAKKAYAIIATSEEAVYANVLLKKGVVK